MRNSLQRELLLVNAALLSAGNAVRAGPPQPEIVVAARYLQRSGTNHAHLCLCRADGKFLRQLTAGNIG